MSETDSSYTANQIYSQLDGICQAGLKASLNAESKVYDLQLMKKKWHNTYDFYPTEDLTSTAICLIGITRAHIDPAQIDLNIRETLSAMNDLAKRRAYQGGFGLVLWANAVAGGADLNRLQNLCNCKINSIPQFVSNLTTMETGWLVSGLAHEYQRTKSDEVKSMLLEAAYEIIDNRYQQETQVVAHTGKSVSFPENIRQWIANFADQVYSIQALAFTAIVTGDEKAREVSEKIAARMVEFQGDKGQWWWHYDAKRGGSPQPYSVYSVHQHGMAPMALHALARAGGTYHQKAIDMSIAWLTDNEIGAEIVDTVQPTLWRSIEYKQSKLGDLSRKSKSLFGVAGDQSKNPVPALQVNYETRPYEWAWCLYASAIDRKLDPALHLV